MIKILFLGDVFGRTGRTVIKELLPKVILQNEIDLVVVNGENSSGGIGISNSSLDELLRNEINLITGGNHSFRFKEIESRLNIENKIIRPANYPNPCPGRGWQVIETFSGQKVAVINLLGRIFIDASLDCPFKTADLILEEIKKIGIKIILVDFHAEVTSEKRALAWYLDGRASAVFGTHTHVQTNDAQILPEGLAFITDVGMCGPHNSVIGMKKEEIIETFLSGRRSRFLVAKGGPKMQGAILTVQEDGKAQKVELLNLNANF